MGLTFTKLFQQLFAKEEMRILMVGLDATILFKLKLGKIVTTIPTIKFNVEMMECKNITFKVWDVGRHYFQNTQAMIFVVDSNDKDRVVEARGEFHQMLNENELQNAVLLVFANKQDLPNDMTNWVYILFVSTTSISRVPAPHQVKAFMRAWIGSLATLPIRVRNCKVMFLIQFSLLHNIELLQIAQSFQANAINLSSKAVVAPHRAITLPKSPDFEDIGAFVDLEGVAQAGTWAKFKHNVSNRVLITLQEPSEVHGISDSFFILDGGFSEGPNPYPLVGLPIEKQISRVICSPSEDKTQVNAS
ncbi:hypothetical protein L7F22_003471 [Adiantum nelumboides]|nr:hypothetical protein [Adiantum nelumboides]